LNVQIKQIDKINRIKRKIAKIYNDNLGDYLKVPLEKKNEFHVYQTYIVFSEKRDKLQLYLKEKGIQTLVHYPIPIHLQPASKNLGYKRGSFPVAEKLSSEVLSLPSFVGMKDSQIDYVIKNIKKFYTRR
jgi:dTDP-4-amino-4,6-dideoxygalactose transaminase